MIRAAFVMEQHLGHRTFYMNLRQNLPAAPNMQAQWIEVAYQQTDTFWEHQSWIPERIKGALRGRREVCQGLSKAPFDVAFFNTQVPAALGFERLLGHPYILSTDITPIQYDALAAYYHHTPDQPGPIGRLKHQANRMLFKRAARVVPWSHWTRLSLENDYGVPASKIEVIPPGVDLSLWTSNKQSLDQSLYKVRILFVGGDFERKGGPALLQAYQKTGKGRAELHLVTRSEIQPEPDIHIYHGLRPNSPELIDLFRSSHIFVLPTVSEAFGIAAVEASAAGLPIIASRVGGLTEIVSEGETGFLVPPGDADSLTQALSTLLDDAVLRVRMGIASRKRAETHFDARINAARLLTLVQEVGE